MDTSSIDFRASLIFSQRAFRMNDLPQIVSNTALLSKELNQVKLANFLLEDVSQTLERELFKI